MPRRSTGRLNSRAGVAALGSCVSLVLSGGVLTSLALPQTSESTAVLKSAHGVTLIDSSGISTAARSGQVVPTGVSLVVAAGGTATLVTGPRTLIMAGGSRAQVLAPDSTEVVAGDVLALDPAGRPWSLLANNITVSAIRGSVRIDRNYGVRIATYVGTVRIDVTTGATLSLTDLSEAAASQSALPAASAPLALIGDALDRRADPALLSAEDAYTALAAQINADPFVAAAFRVGSSSQPSERVLPVAIAESSTGGTTTPKTTAAAQAEAAQLRLAGGSWAVIGARLGAAVPDVRMKLSAILDGVAAAKSSAAGSSETASAAKTLAALASPAPVHGPTAGDISAVGNVPTASPTSDAFRAVGAPPVISKPASSAAGQRPSAAPAASPGASVRPETSATAGSGSGSANGSGAGGGTGAGTGTATTTTSAPTPGPAVTPSASPTASKPPTPSASPTPTPTTNSGLVGGLLNTVGGLLAPSPRPSS